MSKSCPICGASNSLKKVIVDCEYKIALGESFTVKEHQVSCSVCGETGDFFNDKRNIRAFKKAKDEAELNMMAQSIEGLQTKGYNISYMERVFDLPKRTMNHWKNKRQKSAAAVALVRLLTIFPWLSEVAQANFDKEKAEAIVRTNYELKDTSLLPGTPPTLAKFDPIYIGTNSGPTSNTYSIGA